MGNVTDETYAPGPTLFVVGSAATASRDQARVLAASHDMLTYHISHELLLGGGHSSGFQELGSQIADKLEVGKDVLLQFDPAGSCSPAESRSLVKSLAAMVHHCSRYPGALVVTGGETARAVLDEWGIRRLHLIGEVEPGLPYSRLRKAGAARFRSSQRPELSALLHRFCTAASFLES